LYQSDRPGGTEHFESRHRRKDGTVFPVEIVAQHLWLGEEELRVAFVRDITERKQAEERLQANERRFSQLIQNSFDTIVIMDAEGIQRYVSASAERVHGFSPAELVGIPVIEQMIHPADKEQVSAAFRHIIESGEGGAQYRHRHKEGGWVYLEARGINQLDNPEIKGVVVNVRDITGRKRAEEASEGNRRRFELALRGGRLGLWDWQTQTGAVTYSELWAEILGYALEEVEPTVGFFERHVHPEDRPAVLERLMGHIEGRFPAYHSEHRLRTKSGLWIWVMDRGEISERTTDGRPLRVTGVISDITARKQVEKALRESEQRLRLALRAANQGFYDLDLRTGDAVVSPEYATILGYDPAGFKETNDRWLERLHPDDRQRVEAVYTAYVAGKIPEYSVEFRQRTLEGGWKWILSQGRIVERAADGVPLRMMGTHTDIDERKRAEEQMRHVQKLESLGVLAGGIAHDFNNLLMSMLGNADLALHSMADAHPARDFVHNIVAASQRAAELCRQMLAYAGKGRFVLERLDFSQVVQEMAQILQVSVGKNVTLRYQLAAGLPHVEADASQVRQVVMNLITNASDAVGETPGIVTVVTGSMMCDREYLTGLFPDDELSEGRYVFLEVADTGVGMDEATRERIFDPFFTTKFIGRGLGLAAVLGIVRGHRGAIKVYSEPGQGTTFKALFPTVEGEAERPKKNEIEKPGWAGSGRILLVDDEAEVRQVAGHMLRHIGFDVVEAVDGREAVDRFREDPAGVDCVLLDLTMPRMGGEEAFRELRRIRRNVRVILSSGYNEQEVTQRFAGKGHAGFVQKPYTLARLLEALRALLGEKENQETVDQAKPKSKGGEPR
jgi:PAS domain S-box-containing protein